MRLAKCHLLLLFLVFVNLILLWTLTNSKSEPQKQIAKQEVLNVTIIIAEFETFDNNVEETVHNLDLLYPGIPIIVISSTIPYPYFSLPAQDAQFVVTKKNPLHPNHVSNPMHYIRTKYVLVVPDSARIKYKGAIEELVWLLRKNHQTSHIIAAPVTSSNCVSIDVNLQKWSIAYKDVLSRNHCNQMLGDSALLFETDILVNFTELFVPPFYDSFYIQAKLRNLKLHVTDNSFFHHGKILFADNHYKWKHNNHKKTDIQNLYKRFDIKRVVNRGLETMYGCTKETYRCFPTVLDVPYYLYEGKWTPPCCLNALRETSKHVFMSLESWNVKYWLEGGSLLGAARYSDIIPWDYDVDIGIFMNHVKRSKFLTSVWNGVTKEDAEGFVWEKATEGDFIRVQYSRKNHLHVDIFPFYEKNGTMTKNTWFKTHRQDTEFPAHFLKPLEWISFVGVMASAPNNYKKFLELKFGKGVIENPQYPFPEKLMNVKNLKLKEPPKRS